MGMVQEFKKFAMRGNVIDLAVGVIIGAAFGKVVSSLVDKIVMPLLGLVLGTIDFSGLGVTLRGAHGDKPPLVLNYGAFLQAAFDFLIVAIAIFLMVKAINKMQHKEEQKPPAVAEVPNSEKLLAEIRDLLRARPQA